MKKIIQKSNRRWISLFVPFLLFLSILWGMNLPAVSSPQIESFSEIQADMEISIENYQQFSPKSSDTNIYQVESTRVLNDTIIYSVWTDNISIYECGGFINETYHPINFYLGKRDLEGNLIWKRTELGSIEGNGQMIWGDETGLYVELDTYILCKFDLEGNLVWNCTLPSHEYSESSLWGDGTFIYSYGHSTDNIYSPYSYYLKFNNTGEIIENHTWYDNLDFIVVPFGIYGNNNSIFIVESFYDYPIQGYTFRKWNLNGESIVNKSFLTSNGVNFYDLWFDNNYIYIIEEIYFYENYSRQCCLSKWDVDFNSIWAQFFTVPLDNTEMELWVNENTIFGIFEILLNDVNYECGLQLIAWDEEGNQLWNTTCGEIGYYYDNMTIFGFENNLFVEGCMFWTYDWSLAGFQIHLKLESSAPILNSLFQISTNSKYILLNWIGVLNATDYNIYRSSYPIYTSVGLTPIGSTREMYFYDYLYLTGVYFYGITAVNEIGESALSNCIRIVVQFLEIDAPYINSCIFSKSSKQVYLDWNDVERANYYVVYRSEWYINDLTYLSPRGSTSNSGYSDSVTYSGTYYYVVVAVGNSGESEKSNQVSVYVNLAATTTYPHQQNDPDSALGIFITLIIIFALICGCRALYRASDEQKTSPTSKSTPTSTSYLSTYDKSRDPSLSKNPTLSQMKNRFCPQCGTPCESFGNFCAECGSKLN